MMRNQKTAKKAYNFLLYSCVLRKTNTYKPPKSTKSILARKRGRSPLQKDVLYECSFIYNLYL